MITACAFIYQEFNGELKVFLPKRSEAKKFLPGVYELPGGHIDFGEDIEVGLRREVMEEFGQDIILGDPFAAFTYMNDIKGSHSLEVIYFARFARPELEIVLRPEDHSGFVWAAETDLPGIFNAVKNMDNIEVKAIQRGFNLLKSPTNPFKL